jgi:hypothetical protein
LTNSSRPAGRAWLGRFKTQPAGAAAAGAGAVAGGGDTAPVADKDPDRGQP